MMFFENFNVTNVNVEQCWTVIDIWIHLPNAHSFFDVSRCNWIGQINYELCELLHIDNIFWIIWIGIDNFRASSHLWWNEQFPFSFEIFNSFFFALRIYLEIQFLKIIMDGFVLNPINLLRTHTLREHFIPAMVVHLSTFVYLQPNPTGLEPPNQYHFLWCPSIHSLAWSPFEYLLRLFWCSYGIALDPKRSTKSLAISFKFQLQCTLTQYQIQISIQLT